MCVMVVANKNQKHTSMLFFTLVLPVFLLSMRPAVLEVQETQINHQQKKGIIC